MFNYWNVAAAGHPIPDLILDIGSPPAKRFAVHSSVVIHHSHYLRNLIGDCRDSTTPEKTLYLPTISSEQFSILLNYMYTGFLDIGPETVFSVLLAAHTLHMPKVLELCTSYMLQNQLREEWTGGNYGGNPSVLAAACGDATTNDEGKIHQQCVKIVKPIASKAQRADFSFISSPAACILLPSASETPFRAVNTSVVANEGGNAVKSPPTCLRDRNAPTPSNASQCSDNNNPKSDTNNTSRAIVDIASCDGPVRFRRVLNLAIFHDTSSQQQEDDEESQNIPTKLNSKTTTNQQQSNEVFSCLHCKHTFRSQYCYLKHAKRHLYPPDTTPKSPQQQQPSSKSPSIPDEATHSTNVQYYPCKICGCKFPSYYFVHKHRKLCHRGSSSEE
ncbi:telomere zinc finger-associated protein [Lutzomyia longipalpis]|uniref:telomere zinc finger-associated protein n=1 Tax=Lutzomyia longipalpis TaxID=7200 RepID=UPI002483F58E|nr:telomere zinc finger-associated protein [Lutzomyia longipalpis]